eukprot:CAMPEP_0198346994 /NCGR_PEP_ID=MMETSP1450-20131203/82615_1 /TAXON_ID=753684 ORGANISM="Madagascaria erythrocladiodes, Strain CCMP3234" /NCGR_SAMPLE_ID=MMETSP1450 /ASSEMBLY_ACC=CAM_ASM_001115 /LENGTH=163 /DNA_ID=CAMNT_0044052477 /DNA_START=475 /DNA_END=966 /DNA_ORIENTATION=+
MTTAEYPTRIIKQNGGLLEREGQHTTSTSVNQGTFRLAEDTLTVCIETPTSQPHYPLMRLGTVHWTMVLNESHPGARNLLYVESHFAIDFDSQEPLAYGLDRFADRPFVAIPLTRYNARVKEVFPDDSHQMSNWDRFYTADGKLDRAKLYSTNLHIEMDENEQ